MKIAYRPYGSNATRWEDVAGKSIEAAKKFIREDLWVHDTDGAGEETCYVGIKLDNEYTYFKVTHSWYWVDWFEEHGSRYVGNDTTFKKITKEEAAIADDRDWLDLRPTRHPENLNWPPKELVVPKTK